MHRQPSRNTANMDTIDCLVNTNDLAQEYEVVKHEERREPSNSRRDQPSKRSNDNSNQRSNRHSPPLVTRKRHASPPPPVSSSRSHHQQYPPQRHHRPSSPSPSPPPPPQSSSRHRRPVASVKRAHSKSRSPYDRRPPTHRSRPESSKERTIDDVLTSIASSDEHPTSKRITPKHETADLSLVSEDELIKTHDSRSNGRTTNENKLHSTPSVPILHPNSSENPLDMSNISRDCELSLFANSALSNNNSVLPSTVSGMTDCMQTIDLITKYKMMQSIPNNNSQVEACSKEILILIQKQIELQKSELNCREREIKLRERELAEREKRFKEKPIDTTSVTSAKSEPFLAMKSIIIDTKTPITNDQDITPVSHGESVTKTILPTVDTSKINLSNKSGSNQPSVTRKTSRFSQITVDPSIFGSQYKPVVDLYSDDHDDNQSSSSINTNNSLKKTTISKILAPSESTISIVDTDLKVTSSNSFRKVEFQSGNIDKTITSKGSSHDLRLTLSNKHRTKHQNNDDDDTNPIGNQLTNDDEIKSKTKDDDKQQSLDYQQQRSVTSTSIEPAIDNTDDKRDTHRQQQRTNSSRQPQYSSSSTINSDERSYTHGSTLQQPSKYGSNQKRQETDDLRSSLFERKNPKSSRTTHRNNY